MEDPMARTTLEAGNRRKTAGGARRFERRV
jgi:hypothetical protein